MGGLVVKQMLYQAKTESYTDLFNNTVGIVRVFAKIDYLSYIFISFNVSVFFIFSAFTFNFWFYAGFL